MIHYIGGPITPNTLAAAVWHGNHAMISFATTAKQQIADAAFAARSFVLDNGAFSFWNKEAVPDWKGYYAFVEKWKYHPNFDWAIIPDVIEGGEGDNDSLLAEWPFSGNIGIPVWHLHESTKRLKYLCSKFHRVALGSSGEYSKPSSTEWWYRMAEVMEQICDKYGRPPAKLHGLRMQHWKINKYLPLSSDDSTSVATNCKTSDALWRGTYLPPSDACRAMVMTARLDHRTVAEYWDLERLQLDNVI